MPRLRVSILNWTGNRNNWGCQATSLGLVEDLKEACPGYEIEFHEVRFGKKRLADRVVETFYRGFVERHLSGESDDSIDRARFDWLTTLIHGEDVKKVADADVVVFMAEGTMTGGKFFRNERLLMLPYLAATQLGKSVISLNQTIYSPNDRFARLIKNAYGKFAVVAVREPASQSYANKLGIKDVVFFPDSAFRASSSGRPVSELVDGTVQGEYICLTASGDYSIDESNAHFLTVLRFAKEQDMQVCGLFWQHRARTALELAHAETGGRPLLFARERLDYKDVNAILAGSFCLAGGRYHTAIQAATEAVPFIAVPSGTHKTAGLLQMLDYPLPERAFDDETGISGDLARIMSDREEMSNLLKKRMEAIHALRARGTEFLGKTVQAVHAGEDVSELVSGAATILRLDH